MKVGANRYPLRVSGVTRHLVPTGMSQATSRPPTGTVSYRTSNLELLLLSRVLLFNSSTRTSTYVRSTKDKRDSACGCNKLRYDTDSVVASLRCPWKWKLRVTDSIPVTRCCCRSDIAVLLACGFRSMCF